MPRWCGGFPFDGGCVPPAGWAEAGGADQPHGVSVMSFWLGAFFRQGMTVLSVGGGWCAAGGGGRRGGRPGDSLLAVWDALEA